MAPNDVSSVIWACSRCRCPLCCIVDRRWAVWWVESQKRPSMSYWDSLVAEVGCVVGGKPEKPTNKSPGLVGGRGGLCGGWKARKDHRVTRTRWWQRWAMWWVESQKNQPMSHRDSLVVVVGRVVGGKPEKATNESQWLIGGRGGLCGGWKARKANQWVTRTRWWQRWATWWVESQKRPPTSHWDSLVVEVGHVVGGKPEKATNELPGLVGGRGGPCGGWKARKANQWVTRTCWWQRWATWWVESQKRPPTSHWDSLVVEVGHVVGGKPEKPTNKSPGFVGGRGGLCGGWKARKTNQWVTGTRWWWWWWWGGGVNTTLKCGWTWGWMCPGGGGGVVLSSSIFKYFVSKKKKRNKKIKTYLLPRDVNVWRLLGLICLLVVVTWHWGCHRHCWW